MSSDDFLAWDDLPLEFILGEFTEDEQACSDNSSDSNSEAVEPAKDVNLTVKRPKKIFQCPDCVKTFCSISGFRGHVSKKHNKPHLKGKLQ